jgi:hypothetical protein
VLIIIRLPQDHDHKIQLHSGCCAREKNCVCGAAPSRLPTLLYRQSVLGDGRQYRACDQLLAALSEIPFAGARRLCRDQPLDAVLVLRCLFRRACRPARLSQSDTSLSAHVRGRFANLGHTLSHRHHPSLARVRLVGCAWNGRRAGRAGKPTDHPRYRRP